VQSAALALAATYDPLVLKQLRVVGAKEDIAEARVWYQKAAQLGSAEAAHGCNNWQGRPARRSAPGHGWPVSAPAAHFHLP
jgi:TPR repeat protein